MARILYAWELGAGFGHVYRMGAASQILARCGHDIVHAVKDLRRFASHPDNSAATVVQAPLALEPPSTRHAINYADVLRMCGYTSADTLTALLNAWAFLIEHSRADLVLVDHAPTAALAARGLGRPFLSIGNGFEIPPETLPMQSLQPWKDAGEAARADVDRSTLAIINEAHERRRWRPLASITELFTPRNSVIASPRPLDHYHPRTGSWTYATALATGDSTHRLPWPKRRRARRIFAYLTSDPSNVAWLSALAKEYAVLAYLRDLSEETRRELKRRGVAVANRPLDANWACQNADLVLCHGGIGLLSTCLRNAKPVVVAPQHPEQALSAYHVANAEIGAVAHPELSPEQLLGIVATTLADADMPVRVAEVAAREDFDPSTTERVITAAVEQSLG